MNRGYDRYTVMKFTPMNSVTLQQLQALVCLAEERSFSRAAVVMRLSQPSLTKHIRNLEDTLSATLVDRRTHGITLTPEGKILTEHAKRLFKLLDEAAEKIERARDSEAGCIEAAASTIPATYILPRLIPLFRERYPGINCYIRTGDSDGVIDMILNEEAQVGFIGKGIEHRKLVAKPLWKDRLVLVVPSRHRWRGKKKVSLEEILSEPFVARERGSATRAITEEYLLARRGVDMSRFNVVCELGSSEAVKEAVISGMGVSIISIHAVRRDIETSNLFEVPLEDCAIERDFHVIYLKQFMPQKYHTLFLDFLEREPVSRHYGEDNSLR